MAKRVKCRICNKDFKIIAPNHLAFKHGVSFRKYRRAFPDVEGDLWCDETVDKQSGNFVTKWRQKNIGRIKKLVLEQTLWWETKML